jgi:alpha-L-fucosidase
MNLPPCSRTEILIARPLPGWYDDAKFGIFIHWGLWAIPAFAARLGSITDAVKADYDRAMAMIPYTEWYANAIKVSGTPSAQFHRQTYGDAPYEAFKEPFLAGLEKWDPNAWAETFRDAGAGYVVLVTKHHDGFCLWPSAIKNPNQPGWSSGRDLVGELANAVRAAGLRFGVYYSGGMDWTFNRRPMMTIADVIGSKPGGAYPAYAEAQLRELIARYQPSVLWNDISWPTAQIRLNALFADYYRAVPEGVVNDRWVTSGLAGQLVKLAPLRRILDWGIKRRLRSHPESLEGIIPAPVPHSDFRTPEYARFAEIQAKKWEATRGMSHSFGFNRRDTEDDYAPAETLLGDFLDGVSKNGNLLLNVGPEPGGLIPTPQVRRLQFFGAWLRANGEAVFATRPWIRAESTTADGLPVRFTHQGGNLYLIILGACPGQRITVRDLKVGGVATRLADGAPIGLLQDGPDLTLELPSTGAGFAPAFRIAGAGASGADRRT